jgi:hypothetical protein
MIFFQECVINQVPETVADVGGWPPDEHAKWNPGKEN